jgi:dihydrolipoamide dehydrogenase
MPTKQTQYDVIVIGAGPAGYSSAVRCSQLGFKTLCIDNWTDKHGQGNLGGFYLNSGCIASLALLESAKLYHTLKHNIKNHGIHAESITLDVPRMIERKNAILETLREQIIETFNKNAIELIHAKACLLNARQVEITPINTTDSIVVNAGHIILATGSSSVELPCAPLDNEFIINSATAVNLNAVPKKLAIIGGGIAGLELASIWNRLGAEIVLLEARPRFLSMLDQELSSEAYRIFSEQGLDIRLGARVTSTKKANRKVSLEYQDNQGTHELRVDKLIVASGRRPNTEKLSTAGANLLLDENGYVHVDDNCRTNLPGVYAIGDLTLQGPMLAHKGIEEGNFVAEHIAGLYNPINYNTIPSIIYTDPEIAWVGQTEQALKATGESFKVNTIALTGNVMAQARGKTEGLVKIITHAQTDSLLGVHIISSEATELIAEAVLAMEFSASSEDLARTIHAHPSFSESLRDGALELTKNVQGIPLLKDS